MQPSSRRHAIALFDPSHSGSLLWIKLPLELR